MSGEFRLAGAEETERLLCAARETLTDARERAGQAGADRSGTAFDGLVRARLGADGTVSDLVLDPRLMRLPAADLAAGVREAVNEALRSGRDEAASDAPALDLAMLGDQIAELQTRGMRQKALRATARPPGTGTRRRRPRRRPADRRTPRRTRSGRRDAGPRSASTTRARPRPGA